MKSRYKNLFWVLAVVAALSFDQLFWKKPGGINFFLFVLIVLLGGLIPSWLEKIQGSLDLLPAASACRLFRRDDHFPL